MSGIDIKRDKLVAIPNASELIPGHPHRATIWRWVLNGLRGVKLDSIKVGGRRFTSAEAISQFIEKMSEDCPDESSEAERGSLSQNHQKAEQKLSEEGF